MNALDKAKERGRGYNALFFVILGAYFFNTVGLAIAIWTMTLAWQGILGVATTLFYYLVIFVLDKVAKAALISRDIAINHQAEESRVQKVKD